MLEFWSAVGTQPLAFNAVLAALFLSVACGMVGTYVVIRRITYIAAGVAHCVLGGMGAARYLQVVWNWHFFHPLTAPLRRLPCGCDYRMGIHEQPGARRFRHQRGVVGRDGARRYLYLPDARL